MNVVIPLPPGLRLAGPLAIALIAVAASQTPVAPVSRIWVVLVILFSGGVSWYRFMSRRVARLTLDVDGQCRIGLSNGREAQLVDVLTGLVSPRLMTAKLRTASGDWVPLIMSGRCVPAEQHWQVRRTLLAWRPAESQPSTRRGT